MLWFCGFSLVLIAILYYVSFTWAFGVPRQGACCYIDRGELKLYRDAFWEMPNELTMTLILLHSDVDYFPSSYWWPASTGSPSWLPQWHGGERIARTNNASFAPVLRAHGGVFVTPMYFFMILAGLPWAYLFLTRNKWRNLIVEAESLQNKCRYCGDALSGSASDSCPECREKVTSVPTRAT